jgi:hypothetical protein
MFLHRDGIARLNPPLGFLTAQPAMSVANRVDFQNWFRTLLDSSSATPSATVSDGVTSLTASTDTSTKVVSVPFCSSNPSNSTGRDLGDCAPSDEIASVMVAEMYQDAPQGPNNPSLCLLQGFITNQNTHGFEMGRLSVRRTPEGGFRCLPWATIVFSVATQPGLPPQRVELRPDGALVWVSEYARSTDVSRVFNMAFNIQGVDSSRFSETVIGKLTQQIGAYAEAEVCGPRYSSSTADQILLDSGHILDAQGWEDCKSVLSAGVDHVAHLGSVSGNATSQLHMFIDISPINVRKRKGLSDSVGSKWNKKGMSINEGLIERRFSIPILRYSLMEPTDTKPVGGGTVNHGYHAPEEFLYEIFRGIPELASVSHIAPIKHPYSQGGITYWWGPAFTQRTNPVPQYISLSGLIYDPRAAWTYGSSAEECLPFSKPSLPDSKRQSHVKACVATIPLMMNFEDEGLGAREVVEAKCRLYKRLICSRRMLPMLDGGFRPETKCLQQKEGTCKSATLVRTSSPIACRSDFCANILATL